MAAITEKMMERWRKIYFDAQLNRKNYQCPICGEWVFYPNSHFYRVGENNGK
jgi:ribosomal protein S27AE